MGLAMLIPQGKLGGELSQTTWKVQDRHSRTLSHGRSRVLGWGRGMPGSWRYTAERQVQTLKPNHWLTYKLVDPDSALLKRLP